MIKLISLFLLFTVANIFAFAGSTNQKTIQYNKKFNVEQGGKIRGSAHKKLIYYNATNEYEEIMIMEITKPTGQKMKVVRKTRYKEGKLDRPTSSEYKTYSDDNFTQKSTVTFQEKSCAIETTQYFKDDEKLNKALIVKKTEPLPDGVLHMFFSIDTIGLKTAKKKKQDITLIMFPENPDSIDNQIKFKKGYTLIKSVDSAKKTTTYTVQKKNTETDKTEIILNNKNKVISFEMMGGKLIEIKK